MVLHELSTVVLTIVNCHFLRKKDVVIMIPYVNTIVRIVMEEMFFILS